MIRNYRSPSWLGAGTGDMTKTGVESMTQIDTSPDRTQIHDDYIGTAENTRSTSVLLRELVAHLRDNRTQLREEWARRITEAKLLTAMTKDEIFAEATSVYDNYVEALETGTFEALQAYARNLSERIDRKSTR